MLVRKEEMTGCYFCLPFIFAMLTVTKIFRFETAHAIHGYPGSCAHIHGHSYVLHVTVTDPCHQDAYLADTGIMMDFKDLKQCVQEAVVRRLDHQLVLSADYLRATGYEAGEACWVFPAEPTAENLLLWMRREIAQVLPADIALVALTLWETADSYATWSVGAPVAQR